jgi:GPH family glycoside/pentoside/hexuronide:cation symporter
MNTTTDVKISARTKILYGVADVGLALQQAAVQFFLLFYYTDIAGVNPALAGSALLVSKLTWDAINDPLFGYLSDRTRSRWGRRRPYMLFAAVPLGLAFWLMFSLPTGLTGGVAFLAVMGTFLLFDTFHTMISMAYYAMTAEMTTGYEERTSITAVRMVFSILGYILGAAVTTVIAGLFGDLLGWTEKASWSGMGLTFGILTTIVVLTTALTVRHKPVVKSEPTRMPPVSAFLQTLRNKPFLRLIAAGSVASLGFTLITSLLPFYLIYQLDMEEQLPIVMLALLGTIALFLFPTKMLSDRINKGPAYGAGLGLASLAMISTFFLPQGPTLLIYAIAVVAGIGFAGQWVFPGSMVPDVVELDERQTGERREGLYFGVWALVGKFTGALGIAISGWALALFGYVEGAAQTPTALLGIRLFFGLVPAIILLASTPLLFWYPITKESHSQLVDELSRLRA